ncbi:hypothetical protein D0867_16471, partial [Hortaea werneckii]
MKRREYSVASSQKVTPNSISLLIVTVNWVDPKGRDRFGQATRYLNNLPVGAPVTVSVKPSVMKLPPKSTQPIIMAGLGTGLAPFRAFVQERAWQREQGMPIGDVFLYMGARHQREEYLYGEEWEAYQDAGIITLIGRAFSRDQPQKIYIQDRMRQTLHDIRRAYLREEGAFYLCGPTWPVPDVTSVLEEAVEVESAAAGDKKKKDGHKEIEKLKEEGILFSQTVNMVSKPTNNRAKAIVDAAAAGGWCVPAMCLYNLEGIIASVRAAEAKKSPLLIQLFPWAVEYADGLLVHAAAEAAKKAKVPVAVHMDHCQSPEMVKRAADLGGFDGIMVDMSHYEKEENLKLTTELTEYCHARGVITEAEPGRINGGEDGVSDTAELEGILTTPEQAQQFISTGIDWLAPAYGNVHGKYGPKGPQLQYDRLKSIRESTKGQVEL